MRQISFILRCRWEKPVPGLPASVGLFWLPSRYPPLRVRRCSLRRRGHTYQAPGTLLLFSNIPELNCGSEQTLYLDLALLSGCPQYDPVPSPGLASVWLVDTGSVSCGLGHQQTYLHLTCSVDGTGGRQGKGGGWAMSRSLGHSLSYSILFQQRPPGSQRILNSDLVLPGHYKHAFVKAGGSNMLYLEIC